MRSTLRSPPLGHGAERRNKQRQREEGDQQTGRWGDGETRGWGDRETRRRRRFALSPHPPFSPSFCPPHRFLQTGFRFSMNALMPSLASSVFINSCRYISSTSASTESSERPRPRSSARRVASRDAPENSRSFERISCVFCSRRSPGTT